MAGLINTGIWGFISSAKATGKKILNAAGEEIDEWVSTFVSGASGWLIDKLGNAEFKSVFVRDKFITNEFVYNRIKVTEDEEIISSSVKIASYIDNEDGTFTVYPDLREGDYNPLAEDDLVMGYYHNPGNSGVIYAVQKFKAISDPSKDGQSIILEPEGDSIPYQHMIIVRVGNITDEERQSFIRISSKTNCQYFYDGIDSWDAYIDPDHVKCVLGHADMGLIPAWAREAVSGVKRWFGLIADGVIIRGTFILHNDKTIEDELNGREIQLRGDFQIREDGITGKWQEVIKYAEQASDAATAAGTFMKKTEELSGEFNVNYEKLSGEFKSKVDEEVKDSLGTITKAKDEATSSLQLTARDFVLEFTDVLDKQTVYATGAIDDVKRTAESSLKMTADDLVIAFNEHVETKTDEANGEISETTEYAKSQIKLSADALSVSFEKELNEKVKKADGAITDVKNKATSELQLTADKLKLDFTDILDEKVIGANGEITDTKNLAKSELSRTAKELTDKFTEKVTDAEGDIIKEIGTQVTQNAKEWKTEVMGTDANGNPLGIIAAINASEEGINIEGEKINLTGGVVVKGSFSSPFHKYTDKFDSNGEKHDFDNVVPVSFSANTAMELSWDLSQSGRRRVLVNWKWNGSESQGYVRIEAPEGKYFFEDGIGYSDLTFSREAVELIGYGDDNNFLGWIVLNRCNVRTTRAYGPLLHCVAQGVVTVKSPTDVTLQYSTYRGSKMSVARISEGIYRITFPKGWNLWQAYYVIATGIGNSLGAEGYAPVKATLIRKDSTLGQNESFDIAVADDASLNDGSFAFQMFSTADWDIYSTTDAG